MNCANNSSLSEISTFYYENDQMHTWIKIIGRQETRESGWDGGLSAKPPGGTSNALKSALSAASVSPRLPTSNI